MLETGLLVSCAYDKRILAWQYETRTVVEEFKRNEEFRCLDYISSTKILLAGTNDKSILTFNIEHLLHPGLPGVGGMPGEEEMTPSKEALRNLALIKEVDEIEDMAIVQRMYEELKMKEVEDRKDPANVTEFLEEQEIEDDD